MFLSKFKTEIVKTLLFPLAALVCLLMLITNYFVLNSHSQFHLRNPIKKVVGRNHVINPELNSYLNIRLEPMKLCEKNLKKKFIFIYVFVAVASFEKRDVIRRTWANKMFEHIQVAFIIGKSSIPDINLRAEKEHKKFNDLLQGDFIDAYRNLSYKSLITWKWILSSECSAAKYIVKIDDDLVLNTFNLLRFLNDENKFYPHVNFSIPLKLTFFGEIFNMRPIKDINSKWHVTDKEYNKELYRIDHYSNFCHGPSVVMTSDLIKQLYDKSYDIKVFWIDDVYVGILGRYINANFVQGASKFIDISQIVNVKNNDLFLFVKGTTSTKDFESVWSILQKEFKSK